MLTEAQRLALTGRYTREIHAWLVEHYPNVGRTRDANYAVVNALIRNAVILIALGTAEPEKAIEDVVRRMRDELPAWMGMAEKLKKGRET